MKDDDQLSHYTSAEGLIGLLGNPSKPATMWLTEANYMNDASELNHAFELAREMIVRGKAEWPGCRRVIAGTWGILLETDRLMPLGPTRHRQCVFSLSEEPDLLSQWRGYVPNGGYAIGFRLADLRTVADANGLSLEPCVYDDNAKRQEIADALRAIEQGLERREIDLPASSLHSIKVEDQPDATARVRIQRWVDHNAPRFKHSSFREEREWRLVGIVGVNDPRSRWRARGAQIVPYCELDISSGGPSPLSAQTVVIGPGMDFELSEHAIRGLNFDRWMDMKFRRSSSTLRL